MTLSNLDSSLADLDGIGNVTAHITRNRHAEIRSSDSTGGSVTMVFEESAPTRSMQVSTQFRIWSTGTP